MNEAFVYTLLSGVDTTLRDQPPLRRHVPLSAFYRSVKALLMSLFRIYFKLLLFNKACS